MNLDQENFLSAYLDAELSPEHRARVEVALLAHPQLAEDHRALASVHDLISTLSRPALPQDLSNSIVAQIESRRHSGAFSLAIAPASLSWLAKSAALAAAAAIVAVSVFAFRAFLREPGQKDPFAHQGPRSDPRPARSLLNSSFPDLPEIVFVPNRPDGSTFVRTPRNQHPLFRAEDVHKVFNVTDLVGRHADRRVGEILESIPRRNRPFARITVTQGILIDPRHPGGGVVFAAVMDDSELQTFTDLLIKSFPDAVEEAEPRPEVVAQLAGIGQMAINPVAAVAELVRPSEAPPTAASVVEVPKEPLVNHQFFPESSGHDPLLDPNQFLGVTDSATDQAGPTPEQERSGPHPSLRNSETVKKTDNTPKIDQAGQAARRDTSAGANFKPRAGSVVLVWVSTPSQIGSKSP